MDADRLLGNFVRPNMKDVFAHVEVSGLLTEGLVGALGQNCVALLKRKQQDLLLKESRSETTLGTQH